MKLVVLGPSITYASRDGRTGHCHQGLLREFARRGHEVTFLEHDNDSPWGAPSGGAVEIPGVSVAVYSNTVELERDHAETIREADGVMVASGLQESVRVCDWVLRNATGCTIFHDHDTPHTLAELRRGGGPIARGQVARFQLYLASGGGPCLAELEQTWHSPAARPLYCAIEADAQPPEPRAPIWDLGYLGGYRPNRQRLFERLLLRPAERLTERTFLVAGDGYPPDIVWPRNIERLGGLPIQQQRSFHRRQRFILHLSPAEEKEGGWSLPRPLLEAAASGTPVISDCWPGIEEFFTPGHELLLATTGDDITRILRGMSDADARAIGDAARLRVLAHHTTTSRAAELERLLAGLGAPAARQSTRPTSRTALPQPAAV
jgi:spore maturation protein CgeB